MAVTERARNTQAFNYLSQLMVTKEGVRSVGDINVQIIREGWEDPSRGLHSKELRVQLYIGGLNPEHFVQGFKIEKDRGVVGEISEKNPLVESLIESGDPREIIKARKRRVQDVAAFVRTTLEQSA